ncbi:MAG: hypothetical protein ACE5EC_01950 [Phycisphaerae bacterium]
MKKQLFKLCLALPAALLFGCATNAVPGGRNGMPAGASLTAGSSLYQTPQMTNFGVSVSCQSCHGEGGSGGRAPAITGYSVEVLESFARGDASHPAPTGRRSAKFPEMDNGDFEDIAAFLRAEAGTGLATPIAGAR